LKIWDSNEPLLFHNAKFDVDVAQTHMQVGDLDWRRVHDTLYLVFFEDPHAVSHALKPSSERLLGMVSEERDEVRDWLVAAGLARKGSKSWGAHIAKAPGDLVGKYADGDVIRTERLFKKLYPVIVNRGMLPAYDRERELMPILLANEKHGVRADLDKLETDIGMYKFTKARIDDWLRKQLGSKEINLDADDDVVRALVERGLADPTLFLLTPTGKPSMSKDSVEGAVTNKNLLLALRYRAKLSTFLGTFLEPWQRQAIDGEGWIYPSWNQVKQYGSWGDAGARTGRLSASRFMNAPKTVNHDDPTAYGYVELPKIPRVKLPGLPQVRTYILPDKKQVWCKRDYSQQELRILGHFEDGALLQAYQQNPKLNVHTFAAAMIGERFNLPVTRDQMKTVGFGLLYGMGLGTLAERLGVDVTTAQTIKKAYMDIFPGLRTLQNGLKQLSVEGQPIATWGGRQYYTEPPKMENGRKRTFEYKLLNYLIQGSAADCTKQAIINYHNHPKSRGQFLLTVHDEINFSVEPRDVDHEMGVLREAMLDVAFDVPMLSDGAVGHTWGNLSPYKDPS
jgi:DNA polymerase-1